MRNCLGRVKGLFIDEPSGKLFVRMFTHEQCTVHVAIDESVTGIDWILLGDSELSERGSDVFECSLNDMMNVEVVRSSVNHPLVHQKVCVYC